MEGRSSTASSASALLYGSESCPAPAAVPAYVEAATQTDALEEWLFAIGDDVVYRQVCAELLAENGSLQEQVASREAQLMDLRLGGLSATVCAELLVENGSLQDQVAALKAQLSDLRLGGSSAGPSQTTPSSVDRSYLVLRTPPNLEHLRGWHQASWLPLMRRLGLDQDASSRDFHIRLYTDRVAAEALWGRHRLRLPIPIDPQ